MTLPVPGAPTVPKKLPLRARWSLWLRRSRFAWALALVRSMDGMVISKAALDAAVLELGKLPGWADEALHGRPRLAVAFTARVEDVAQFLLLSTEIGNPALQAQELVNLYARVRMLSRSRRQKRQMAYEAALRNLPPRKPGEVVRAKRPGAMAKGTAVVQPGKPIEPKMEVVA